MEPVKDASHQASASTTTFHSHEGGTESVPRDFYRKAVAFVQVRTLMSVFPRLSSAEV
jgi:hypothetical protein